MSEKMDMTITLVYQKREGGAWTDNPALCLLDAEYVDTNLINLHLLGLAKEYLIQFRLDKFLELMAARDIPIEKSS